jgi:hypothetical protein
MTEFDRQTYGRTTERSQKADDEVGFKKNSCEKKHYELLAF